MSILGKRIKLIGLSQKGKNRVRGHGDEWMVLAETNHVLFASNMSGPWLFITPKGKDQHDKACRWIKKNNDVDFDVIVLDG